MLTLAAILIILAAVLSVVAGAALQMIDTGLRELGRALGWE